MTMEELKEVTASLSDSRILRRACLCLRRAHAWWIASAAVQIQEECMADDVEIPHEATAWIPSEARAYFESGGRELPTIMGGFEGAEIHAFYEMEQRRFETTDSDTMLDALSAALFKTTGDEQFKPQEKEPTIDSRDVGTRERVRYEPTLKYACPQIGDKVRRHRCITFEQNDQL